MCLTCSLSLSRNVVGMGFLLGTRAHNLLLGARCCRQRSRRKLRTPGSEVLPCSKTLKPPLQATQREVPAR